MKPDAEFEEGMDIAKAQVVVLSEGRIGHQNQSVGVVEMLGIKDPEVITIHRKFEGTWFWKFVDWLPVPMIVADYDRLVRDLRRTEALVGAGFLVSRVLRDMKRRYPKMFTVALMRPSGKLTDYDVVAMPQHSAPKAHGNNVVVTLASPNRVTRDRLALEGDRWRKRLLSVKGLKVAVLIGGTSKHGVLTPEEAKRLVLAVAKPLKDVGGLMVTTSRRTGPEATAAVEKALEKCGVPYHFWKPDDPMNRDNPYFAYLALADAVVMTAESMSMAGEVATAGKPLYLWGNPKAYPAKFRSLYSAFVKQGRAKWWDGVLNLRPAAAPLMDTLMVAGFVRAKWMKR
jgi:mitochondrial fission protein ELM1